MQEITSNPHVDYSPNTSNIGAAIDDKVRATDDQAITDFRSYDFEGMREFEQRYEALYIMHAALVNTDKTQLELVDEILDEISGELN